MTTRQESESEQHRTVARRSVAVAGQGSERALAAAAHGAIAFGFVGVGFILSLVITAVIWLVSKKSPYVREQADRAGRYQLFVLLINIVAVILWVLGFALLLSLTGWSITQLGTDLPTTTSLPLMAVVIIDAIALVVTLPLFLVWFYGTIFYGVYGTIRALAGHDFHYPPPPWKRRKRRAQPVVRDLDDNDPDDDLPEDDVRDEILERKLTWER